MGEQTPIQRRKQPAGQCVPIFWCSVEVDRAVWSVAEDTRGWPQGAERFPGRRPEDGAVLAMSKGRPRGRGMDSGLRTAGKTLRTDNT